MAKYFGERDMMYAGRPFGLPKIYGEDYWG
jgi:hypothetical protein